MENKLPQKKLHNLTIENQSKGMISGVEKVISSSDTALYLDTSVGGLAIVGTDFKITKYDMDTGALVFTGKVQSFKYSGKKQSLLKKMFG